MTEITEEDWDRTLDTNLKGVFNVCRYASRVPLRRIREPEDVARAAVYPASDAASQVTAAILPVDGRMWLIGA